MIQPQLVGWRDTTYVGTGTSLTCHARRWMSDTSHVVRTSEPARSLTCGLCRHRRHRVHDIDTCQDNKLHDKPPAGERAYTAATTCIRHHGTWNTQHTAYNITMRTRARTNEPRGPCRRQYRRVLLHKLQVMRTSSKRRPVIRDRVWSGWNWTLYTCRRRIIITIGAPCGQRLAAAQRAARCNSWRWVWSLSIRSLHREGSQQHARDAFAPCRRLAERVRVARRPIVACSLAEPKAPVEAATCNIPRTTREPQEGVAISFEFWQPGGWQAVAAGQTGRGNLHSSASVSHVRLLSCATTQLHGAWCMVRRSELGIRGRTSRYSHLYRKPQGIARGTARTQAAGLFGDGRLICPDGGANAVP